MTYRNNNALKIYEHMSIKSKEDASIGHTWPRSSAISHCRGSFIRYWIGEVSVQQLMHDRRGAAGAFCH